MRWVPDLPCGCTSRHWRKNLQLMLSRVWGPMLTALGCHKHLPNMSRFHVSGWRILNCKFPDKILVNCWWTKSYLQLGWSKICQLNLSDIWYVHINCSGPLQVGVRRLYFMILWSYSASLSLVHLDVGIQIWSCVQGSSDHHNTTHLKPDFFSVAAKKTIRKISL